MAPEEVVNDYYSKVSHAIWYCLPEDQSYCFWTVECGSPMPDLGVRLSSDRTIWIGGASLAGGLTLGPREFNSKWLPERSLINLEMINWL
jgi:hypothetical protein